LNKEPLVEPMSITNIVIDMHVKADREKIRQNTADDHGLASKGYYYLKADNDTLHPPAGWLAQEGKKLHKDDWTCRYVRVNPRIVNATRPHCCEGQIGSFEIKRWPDGRIVLLAIDKLMIAHLFVCEVIPETLFQRVVSAGLEFDHHESDLYVKDCADLQGILEDFPTQKRNARAFTSEIDRNRWIDIPFSYEPFWIKREGTHEQE